MPRRKLIIAGVNKGKYVLIRNPGERIYCEQCGKVAMAKYPGGRWLCRRCGFNSPEGRSAMELIRKRIRGQVGAPKVINMEKRKEIAKAKKRLEATPAKILRQRFERDDDLRMNYPHWRHMNKKERVHALLGRQFPMDDID